VKLNNLGHINMTSLMKRLKGKGEGGLPVDFFLPGKTLPDRTRGYSRLRTAKLRCILKK
jgi:hypothetical protein